MHSRIFEIRDYKFEGEFSVDAERYTDYDDITGFLGSVADHVEDSETRIDDIKWLSKMLESTGLAKVTIVDENDPLTEAYITLEKGFKEKLFEEKFEKFKRLSNEMTLDRFMNPMESRFLKTSISNDLSFYFDVEGNGFYCLDDFIREIDEETTYYIGNTVDYHA